LALWSNGALMNLLWLIKKTKKKKIFGWIKQAHELASLSLASIAL
jgi:hypothetical protein